jgi:hypothetical protein
MMRFCQVCHKSSHTANECWELDKNAEICPVNRKSVLADVKDAWDTLPSNGGGCINSGGCIDCERVLELEEGTADRLRVKVQLRNKIEFLATTHPPKHN